MAEPISIASGRPREELMIRAAGDLVDLRIFSKGAGPAQVLMPTKQGLTISVEMLPALIAGLTRAEAAARSEGRLIG